LPKGTVGDLLKPENIDKLKGILTYQWWQASTLQRFERWDELTTVKWSDNKNY